MCLHERVRQRLTALSLGLFSSFSRQSIQRREERKPFVRCAARVCSLSPSLRLSLYLQQHSSLAFHFVASIVVSFSRTLAPHCLFSSSAHRRRGDVPISGGVKAIGSSRTGLDLLMDDEILRRKNPISPFFSPASAPTFLYFPPEKWWKPLFRAYTRVR